MKPDRSVSIKRRLTLWIVAALVLFLAVDTTVIYQNTLQSINVAFDRTLLASARAIGDTVKFENSKLSASLPYATLEVFEAVTRGRIVYRVNDFDGAFLSGYAQLPPHDGSFPKRSPYAALAAFYEDRFENESVRVAALLQPVYTGEGYRMVTVQVAETLELRKTLAQQALISTLDRQVIFLMLLSTLVWWLIARGMQPISELKRELLARDPDSLAPIATPAPRELKPLVEALNEVMARLKHVLDDQQRFVRDASHQLRTPLAVLKLQVQNAQRGHMPAALAFDALADSVDRATRVANQMLALAKVAQLDADLKTPVALTDLHALAQDLAVECSPLIAEKALDFALDWGDESVASFQVSGHEWLIRELLRNLISNAIRHTPRGGALGVDLRRVGGALSASVWDAGEGISAEREAKLFEPFSSGAPLTGSGLGLVICRDICKSLGAQLGIKNRAVDEPNARGVRATVLFQSGISAQANVSKESSLYTPRTLPMETMV